MIFACIMDYGEKNLITRIRPKHREYIFGLIDAGKVIAGGSFEPDDDGGLFLYEARNLDEARRLVESDPYVRGGAIIGFKLREYAIHGANSALLRVTGVDSKRASSAT
jgi:uncharacterized protein YciI